jgi:predicted GIY-YIG superfamily endonuclease
MFSSITNAANDVISTPFVKDIKKGGVFGFFTASHEAIERERLKSQISILEDKYKNTHDLEGVLKEYDDFSKSFYYTELVKSIKSRMIKKITPTVVEQSSVTFLTLESNAEVEQNLEQIYVLELEGDKYYVGTTSHMDTCYEHHNTGTHNEFTRIFHPVRILSKTNLVSKYDELNTVLEYMEKYGVANVRGATYQFVNMSESEAIELNKTLMYFGQKHITYNDGFNLDSTDVITFVMHDYGRFTVKEIAKMRCLQEATVLTHLEKCRNFNVAVEN